MIFFFKQNCSASMKGLNIVDNGLKMGIQNIGVHTQPESTDK